LEPAGSLAYRGGGSGCLIPASSLAQKLLCAGPLLATSTSTVPATGLPGNLGDVALDACGNIYTADQSSGSGPVVEIPYGGGAATTVLGRAVTPPPPFGLTPREPICMCYRAITTASVNIPITNCAPAVASQSTIGIGNLGAISYYWGGSAVATDSYGDVFIATNSACCASSNELLEEGTDRAPRC